MPSNLVKKVMLKIASDDGDTEEKLNRISAKADELARKHPDIKVKVDSAAASAKLAVLRRELKDTGNEADKPHRFSLSGITPAIGEMSLFQKVMLATNIATTFAEPLLAGLAVTAGGLASGLTAAGGGLGAFGLLAKTNLTAASAAATAAQSAQTTYTSAVTAANAAYRKQMGAATTSTERQSAATSRATAIQEAYRAKIQATTQAYAGMDPAQVKLSQNLGAIQRQWQKFTSSFAGPTNTVVSQVRPLVDDLLPDVRKLAMAGEAGLSSMLSVAGAHGTGGLNRFISMLAQNAPAAIMKLGIAVAHVGSGIGGILKAFMPASQGILSGLDKITARFATWGQTLSSHSGFQSMMAMFHTETPLAVHDLGQLAGIVKTVIADMTGLSGVGNSRTLLELANPVLALANALLKANPQLVRIALYLLAASSGAKKLGSAFSGIKGGFGALKAGVSNLKNLHAGLTDSEQAAASATGAWGTFGGTLSKLKFSNLKAGFNDADAAASDATGVLGTLGGKLSSIGSGLASAASAVGSFVATYATKLGEAAAATGTWIAEQTAAAATFIAENVAMAASATVAFIAENAATLGLVTAIAALVAGIIYVATHWKQVWHGITRVAVAAWHDIDSGLIHPLEHGVDDLVNFVRDHWKLLATIIATVLLGPVGFIVAFVATHWDTIRHDTAALVMDVVHWFEELPGRILHYVGDFGSLLVSAGKNLVEGLISGIESAASWLHSKIDGLGHDAVGWFKDALGVLSPSKYTRVHGQMLIQGLIVGMDSMHGPLAAAVNRASRTALGLGGTGGGPAYAGALGATGGGAGGWLEAKLVIQGGDRVVDEIMEGAKLYIRQRGGAKPDSVQRALGQR
jgi:hypothetical protein